MIYESLRMRLQSVRTIKSNSVNDILVCRDLNAGPDALYTVLAIKDHDTVHGCLETFRRAELSPDEACVDSFSDQGVYCMVFPYKTERPLDSFYTGRFYTLQECEEICSHVIVTCITSGLPYPLLYLALRQGQLNLSKDHSVYLSYQFDLTDLDVEKTERDCTVECAELLWRLLSSKASEKAFSYRLLEKKINRRSYVSFTELYKDIQLAAAPEKKKGLFRRIIGWFKKHGDFFFRILLVCCIILVIFTLLSLLSQLIFGGIPWLRLFINGFKTIGTETLTG